MTEKLPTAQQLERVILAAFGAKDMEGVVAGLRVMVVVDAVRADEIRATIQTALRIQRDRLTASETEEPA